MKTQVTINWAPKADYQDRNKVIKYINKAAIVNAVTEAQLALAEYDSERPDGSPDMMAKAQLFDEYQRLAALYNRVIAGEVNKVEEPAPVEEKAPEVKPIFHRTLSVIANGLLNFANGDGVNFMSEVREVLKEHSKEQLMAEIAPVLNEKFGQGAGQILQLLDRAIGDDEGEQFLRNYEEGVREAKRAAKQVSRKSAGTTGEKKSKSAPAAEKKGESHGNRADAQDRLDRYTAELKEKEALLTADKFVTKDDKKACVKRIASLHRKIARANRALGIAE